MISVKVPPTKEWAQRINNNKTFLNAKATDFILVLAVIINN